MLLAIILLVLVLLGYCYYNLFYSEKAKAKAAQEEKQREEKQNRQINHYSSQPLVIKVANEISSNMNSSIAAADRQAYVQNIKITYTYSVFDDCITHVYGEPSLYSKGSTLVSFEYERIENLDYSERKLVGIAIFKLVQQNILSTYSKDPGGLDYSIRYSLDTHKVQTGSGKYNEKTHEWVYDHNYGEMFTIIYSCKNGDYKTKTKL